MKFAYKARQQDGSLVSAEIDAHDRVDAVSQLRSKNTHVIAIEEVKSFSLGSISFGGSVKLSEKIIFTKKTTQMTISPCWSQKSCWSQLIHFWG